MVRRESVAPRDPLDSKEDKVLRLNPLRMGVPDVETIEPAPRLELARELEVGVPPHVPGELKVLPGARPHPEVVHARGDAADLLDLLVPRVQVAAEDDRHVLVDLEGLLEALPRLPLPLVGVLLGRLEVGVHQAELGLADVAGDEHEPATHPGVGEGAVLEVVEVDGEAPDEDGGEVLRGLVRGQALVRGQPLPDDLPRGGDDLLEEDDVGLVGVDEVADGLRAGVKVLLVQPVNVPREKFDVLRGSRGDFGVVRFRQRSTWTILKKQLILMRISQSLMH